MSVPGCAEGMSLFNPSSSPSRPWYSLSFDVMIIVQVTVDTCDHRHRCMSTAARGAELKGRNPAQGSIGFGRLGASEFDPLVSAIRGLGNSLPKAP